MSRPSANPHQEVNAKSVDPSPHDGHQLKEGDAIEVYTKSLKAWVPAHVTGLPQPDMVKAEFQVDDCLYRKEVHIQNVSLPLECYQDVWPSEPMPWGFTGAAYKQSIDGLIRIRDKDYFSYWNVKAQGRVLPVHHDEESGCSHRQLWTSKPYARNGRSTCMPAVSYETLLNMNFGVKQKGPFFYNSEHAQLPFFSFKPRLESEAVMVPDDPSKLTTNSLHGMAKMDCCVNVHGPRKFGKGPKFHTAGANGCINAIVTSYDRDGNVRMMAMVRPKKADSDGGDY